MDIRLAVAGNTQSDGADRFSGRTRRCDWHVEGLAIAHVCQCVACCILWHLPRQMIGQPGGDVAFHKDVEAIQRAAKKKKPKTETIHHRVGNLHGMHSARRAVRGCRRGNARRPPVPR